MKKRTKPAAKVAQPPRLKQLIAETRPLNVVFIETHRQIARELNGTVIIPTTSRLNQMSADIQNLRPDVIKASRKLARLYRAFNREEQRHAN